jgi:Tfp pilus assembly protein PilE
MGQQQLLLIILGVIVVGIAVAVGITMFSDSATSANRDAVTNDLVNLASRAQQYYRRPTSLAGGGNKFDGIKLSNLTNVGPSATTYTNDNGSYTIGAVVNGATGSVELVGVGTEKGFDNATPVKVRIIVGPTRIDTTEVQN